jgi:glutamyl-Q tRNA(Asp) synthetase
MSTTPRYVGRFAPSPTGPLHMGSLVTAMASYLEARSRNGLWRLRIEDIDVERCNGAASREIVAQLAACGFEHDGDITWQDDASRRHRYESVLRGLVARELVYPCTCTRARLSDAPRTANGEVIYPGYCARANFFASGIENCESEHAIRFRYARALGDLKNRAITFSERDHSVQVNPRDDVGDFVVKRADQHFAYQLAVVVDDEDSGITHIVRGADLFSNTARQIALIHALGFRQPRYFHVPVVTNAAGEKLSKQTQAPPIAMDNVLAPLQAAWLLLRQAPLPPVQSVAGFWQLAISAWQSRRVGLL